MFMRVMYWSKPALSCARCGSVLRTSGELGHNNRLTAALALAALILYPIAITLPLVKHLSIRNLKAIGKDPNLPEGIRITARKILLEKRH